MKISRLLLVTTVLASCTVGPDYRRPNFYTNNQIQNSLQINGNPIDSVSLDWYARFDDDNLNDLIARGLKESPTVKAAVAKMRQARQSLKVNAVSMFPTIDADGSYHKVSDSVAYGVPVSTSYYQLGLDAAWEMDIWGSGRRLTEESWAILRATSANLDNVQLTLTAEIANNYINLRRAQEQLRISRHNLQLQQEIYEVVKTKYDVGLDDAIAYNQSKYIMETTRAMIPTLESQAEAYQNALTILVGQLPGEFATPLNDTANNLVNRQFKFELSRLYNLPVDVIRNRPDVQVSEQQLIASNAKVGQAIAQLYPNISLSGFLGWQGQNLGHLIGPDTDMFSITPAARQPLFHFGALYNNVGLQKAAKQEQVRLYQNSILTAAAEIRDSMVNIEKEYQRNTSMRQAVTSQREVASLTVDKYRQGLIEFSDVLTSQQDLLSSENQLAASNAAIYQNIIGFYKAVGGGYSPSYHYKPKRTPVSQRAAATGACAPYKG